MSPRSEEFLASAEERLRAADVLLGEGLDSGAVSAAYFAMLYAARAALSEEGGYGRTHAGIWHLFRETFVLDGRFSPRTFQAGQSAQALREGADYDARPVPHDQVRLVVADARRFIAEVKAMLAA